MKLPGPTPSIMVAWSRGQREKPKTNINFKNSPAPTPSLMVAWSRGHMVKEFHLVSLAPTQPTHPLSNPIQPRTQPSLQPNSASNPTQPRTHSSLKHNTASNPTQPRTQHSLEPNPASNSTQPPTQKILFVKNPQPHPQLRGRVVSWSKRETKGN